MPADKIAVVASRHSAFYSPLIATLAGGFLAAEGLEASYATLKPGQRSRTLLGSGEVDVMQSAVGSNWGPMESGISELPVHFAQINRRDGFFLAGREADLDFSWKKLEGRSLVADHGGQPMLMLRYAAHEQGVNWSSIEVIDAGDPGAMDRAFREGRGDYIHQQGPAPQQLAHNGIGYVVASVGAAMPAVAFSSLCAMPAFVESDRGRAFTRSFRKARGWVRSAPPAEVAAAEATYFPDVDESVLATTIEAYQQLGCWDEEIAISHELYEQALDVFLHGRAIKQRQPYEAVVVAPPQ